MTVKDQKVRVKKACRKKRAEWSHRHKTRNRSIECEKNQYGDLRRFHLEPSKSKTRCRNRASTWRHQPEQPNDPHPVSRHENTLAKLRKGGKSESSVRKEEKQTNRAHPPLLKGSREARARMQRANARKSPSPIRCREYN